MKRITMNSNQKGFTLVELIVVIAIIAILASVSLVGFTSYIEKARFSNDEQAAAQMSGLLLNYSYLNDMEGLEAHDVRDIIEDISGSPYDWTPQSSNTGFFYIAESNKIIAAKYVDISDPGYELLQTRQMISLLNDSSPYQLESTLGVPGATPEELFGQGVHLLTTEGDVISETVTSIRNLTQSSDLGTSFEAMYDDVAALDGFFSKLFGGDRFKALLDDLLIAYDPVRTLYVNDNAWVFTTDDYESPYVFVAPEYSYSPEFQKPVGNIVFASGITNIPTYPDNAFYIYYEKGVVEDLGEESVLIPQLTLPKTVKTIEENAFTRFNSNLRIVIPEKASLLVQDNAFNTGQLSRIEGTYSQWTSADMELTINITNDGTTTVYQFPEDNDTGIDIPSSQTGFSMEFVISSLPRHLINSLIITTSSNSSTTDYFLIVKVYTDDGLYGVMNIKTNHL